MSQKSEVPALSVVVIGRNEGARLLRCLESVQRMRSPGGPIELIYVDTASTDGSPEHAAACGARVIIVHPYRLCAGMGRNAGWKVAAAAFVLFLDADTVLHPDFVADSLRQFSQPRVAVIWGHRREIHPEASIYNRVLDLDCIYPVGPSQLCGGDALVRRAVLQEVGGFDEGLMAGGEPELCQRLRAKGYVILHVDRPMTGHDLAITRWAQYWRRALRTGYAYAEVGHRFRHTDTPLWHHEMQRNRLHGLLVAGCPVLILLAALTLHSTLPLIAFLGVSAGIILRTASRTRWKSADPWTLLLYGLHSHVQQVPLLFGQLCYGYDRWRGRRRGLIDYKDKSR